MEIVDQLPITKSSAFSQSSPPPPGKFKKRATEVRYTSSRAREIATLYIRFCKIIYRSKQLLFTNTLEALIVGFLLGTIYIHVDYNKQGMDNRLGFFAFTLTFLLSSTTETLPIFVNERPILLREISSGVYRLSSHLIANTLVFLPYLFIISLLYSFSVYFIVGLCSSWTAFANFVMIVWTVILTANSFVLFVSSMSPNYIAGTTLVTVSLAAFFLFSGYFLSKESMPAYWLFMHYLSPYKYGLDAMLANEYACEAGRCFEWSEEERAVCVVAGKDVLESRGLRVGQRWENLEVLVGYFVLYRVLYWVVLSRRAASTLTTINDFMSNIQDSGTSESCIGYLPCGIVHSRSDMEVKLLWLAKGSKSPSTIITTLGMMGPFEVSQAFDGHVPLDLEGSSQERFKAIQLGDYATLQEMITDAMFSIPKEGASGKPHFLFGDNNPNDTSIFNCTKEHWYYTHGDRHYYVPTIEHQVCFMYLQSLVVPRLMHFALTNKEDHEDAPVE
ncbi:uncharacterized protein A4U43_C06F14060 [Asparagus officinalis]|uniref:ABC-2 type transporter transmembrane domain-containing protein n=1 Tax=Asparagus officinalis TaxID=4686 RepID=A0A5P1EME6_ASPOF|nr:uncharacterized protein A4U43_C06F14060 [Asparagus officinalis]